jgi:hypothetical protein
LPITVEKTGFGPAGCSWGNLTLFRHRCFDLFPVIKCNPPLN